MLGASSSGEATSHARVSSNRAGRRLNLEKGAEVLAVLPLGTLGCHTVVIQGKETHKTWRNADHGGEHNLEQHRPPKLRANSGFGVISGLAT